MPCLRLVSNLLYISAKRANAVVSFTLNSSLNRGMFTSLPENLTVLEGARVTRDMYICPSYFDPEGAKRHIGDPSLCSNKEGKLLIDYRTGGMAILSSTHVNVFSAYVR